MPGLSDCFYDNAQPFQSSLCILWSENCDQSSFERIVSTVYKQAFWNLKDFPETIEIWRLGNFGPVWERIR